MLNWTVLVHVWTRNDLIKQGFKGLICMNLSSHYVGQHVFCPVPWKKWFCFPSSVWFFQVIAVPAKRWLITREQCFQFTVKKKKTTTLCASFEALAELGQKEYDFRLVIMTCVILPAVNWLIWMSTIHTKQAGKKQQHIFNEGYYLFIAKW